MIKSFKDKKTRAFAEGGFVAAFEAFRKQGEKRLRILEAATSLKLFEKVNLVFE